MNIPHKPRKGSHEQTVESYKVPMQQRNHNACPLTPKGCPLNII